MDSIWNHYFVILAFFETFKVSKLIFVCPIIGLALCVYGLFELFRRPKEKYDEDDFKTKIVSVVGNTEQLKIITDDTQEISYVKSETEVEEVGIEYNLLED